MDRREAFTGRQVARGYIIHDALDSRHRGRVMAVCAPVVMGDVGDGCDPKGGGGVDHLDKVQQKKTQTHKRFSRCVVFSDPRGIRYPF